MKTSSYVLEIQHFFGLSNQTEPVASQVSVYPSSPWETSPWLKGHGGKS